MRRLYHLLPVMLTLALASCTGVVVQDDPGPRGSLHPGDFEYATGNGAIETIIIGNPFGGPKQQFDAHVRNLMKHQNRGKPAEYVAGQTNRTDPLYKVVVAFNLPPGIGTDEMCKNPSGLPSRHHTGRLTVAIAFCYGDQMKSDTTGYASEVTSADDPKFAELIRYATRYMIPDTEHERDDSESSDPPSP